MALGDNSINRLNLLMDNAENLLNSFNESLNTSVDQLRGNANYNVFIENTDIGRELNEKLISLNNIGTSTGADIGRLLSVTNDFLEKQRSLNALYQGGVGSVGGPGAYQGGIGSVGGAGAYQAGLTGASKGTVTATSTITSLGGGDN